MTLRALSHAGQVAASTLVAALLVTVGFSGLQQNVSGVSAVANTAPPPTPSVVVAVTSPSPTSSTDPGAFSVARLAPHLDSIEPKTTGVPINAVISMSFSEPMNRSSVESAFAIQPVVQGSFVWLDDFTLRFEPYRLAYATSYQVEVRGRSLRGRPLNGTRAWSFTTVTGPADVLPPGASAINVPILTYHYIRVNPVHYDRMGFALSVTPPDFAAQMDWLARSGYHTITTEELYDYLRGTRGLPSKPVILTFDDGYADFYTTALPILRSHEFKAVSYVVTGFVGRSGYMTSAQVVEADRSGIEIGSHTMTHADLARTSANNVRQELAGSKRFLEQLLGHEVASFCYPSGKVNSFVASAVAAAGFHDATTTRFGFSHALSDRYIWTRLRVSGGESLDQFALAVTSAS